MYWKKNIENLGTFKQHSTFNIVFQASDDIPEILDFNAQCGCTELKYDPKTKSLKVKYKSGGVPKHLISQQKITKTITVIYKNGNVDILQIIGIKIR